jgi:hypothetical protein
MPKMTQTQTVAEMSTRTGLSKKQVNAVLESLGDQINVITAAVTSTCRSWDSPGPRTKGSARA